MNQATLPKRSINKRQKPTTNSRLQNHIDRAEVIARYGDAFKRFDWFIYILAAFLLFVVSLLAVHFLGLIAAGVCASMGMGAIVLLKKKAG